MYLISLFCVLQATHDPHYLQVGKLIVENLNKHARVPCGFAAISDVVTGRHEDQYVYIPVEEISMYMYQSKKSVCTCTSLINQYVHVPV